MMAKSLYTLIDVIIALHVQENKMLLHIRCNHEERFMQQLNFSNNNGFMCYFNDYQLAEFIQHKRRNSGKLPVKSAVTK